MVFRKSRSTSAPLFHRRVVELSEQRTTALYILFLDRSPASIAFVMNIWPFLLLALSSPFLYGQPFSRIASFLFAPSCIPLAHLPFPVEGVPLAPTISYLFILVLTVLMHDMCSSFDNLFHFTPWTFSG